MPLRLRRKLFTKAAAAQQVTDWMPRRSNVSVWTRTWLEEESPGVLCFKGARHVRLHHSARKRIEYFFMSNKFLPKMFHYFKKIVLY